MDIFYKYKKVSQKQLLITLLKNKSLTQFKQQQPSNTFQIIKKRIKQKQKVKLKLPEHRNQFYKIGSLTSRKANRNLAFSKELLQITKQSNDLKNVTCFFKKKVSILDKYNQLTQRYYTEVDEDQEIKQQRKSFENNKILINICTDRDSRKRQKDQIKQKYIKSLINYHPPKNKDLRKYQSNKKKISKVKLLYDTI